MGVALVLFRPYHGSMVDELRPAFHPERLSPHVWRVPVASRTLPPADHTNVYVVGGPAGAVVWDAGAASPEGVEAVRAALEACGARRVEAIVLSHAHPDHVEGADLFQAAFGAPVRAHAAAAERAARLCPGLSWGPPLDEGDRLEAGGADLEVLLTPGHAPGHLAGWCAADGVLLAGDLLAGVGTVAIVPPDGDLRAYLSSLRRVAELGARLAAPGHGPALERPAEVVAALVRHREDREAQVLAALAAGARTAGEITRAVYGEGLDERLRPFAEATVTAHLEKLRAEGRVRPLAGRVWELLS
ncbi:MAG: MBL fold metallo-hydrolase [Firmicutes bacterium]|nr:MBL fold metallo-hydrolase [Bacillota bacterium]